MSTDTRYRAQMEGFLNGDSNEGRSLFEGIFSDLATVLAATGNVSGSNTRNVGIPATGAISVAGANGAFTVTITNAEDNTKNAVVWIEVSFSTVKSFASNVTTRPATTSTSMVLNLVNQTLYFRVRWSYDRKNWSTYVTADQNPVSSGKVSSTATSDAGSFNQTNLGYVTSSTDATTGTIKIQGANGPYSNLVAIKGGKQIQLPAATIVGVTPSATYFVGWNGSKYVLKSTLAQLFDDGITPIGRVTVQAAGDVTLPTVALVLGAGGAVVGWNVVDGGSNLAGPVTLTINTSTGTGATAGTQTIVAGKLVSVAPGNTGQNYASGDTVTASGGRGGVDGGGTSTGGNGGRLTAV